MKAGFLGGKAIAKDKKISNNPVLQAESPTPQAQHEAPQAHTPTAQPSSAGAGPNPASWQQCMELLKSNSDEKKFVGLLLVTKLLPHGNDEALTAVLDAVGWPFLQRMLLPLQQQHQEPKQQQQQTDDTLQQQQLSVALGLSIISAVSRVQDVAASEELLQLAPLLSKVAAAGGVADALQQQQQQQEDKVTTWVDAAADLAAAADALECLLACASSGSYQRSVLLESNGLHTAAAALAAALTVTQQLQCHPAAASVANGDEAAATAGAAAAARAVMLCIQLLGVLLEGDAAARAGLITQHQTEAAAAVMLLAAVFGGQVPEQHSTPASKQGRVQGTDAAALQLDALHALLLLLPLPEAAVQTQGILSAAALALAAAGADASQAAGAAAVKAAEATAAAAGDGSQPGAAVSPVSRQLLLRAAAAAGYWGLALPQGLVQVLRSRVGAVQRHSALQLAAAVLEVLGPNWLLPQQQQQSPQAAAVTTTSSSGSSSIRPEQFLLVLMEVLAIETPLLLSDAMNAGAAVPKSDAAMDAAAAAGAAPSSEPAVPSSSQQGPAPDGDSDMSDGDVEMDDSSQLGPSIQPLSVQEAVQQQQQQSGQQGEEDSQPPSSSRQWSGPPGFQQQKGQQQLKPLRQQLAELKLPEDKPVGLGQQQAGARALQCLPSCYQLLEGCLEVLVHQVGLMDDLADLSQPHTQQHHDTAGPTAAPPGAGTGIDVGGGGVGGRAVSWQEVLPVLGSPQIEQLMGRMAQVTEVVCEFLQHATSQAAAGAGEGGSAAPINPWLVVGAVRLLGRFLADAPDMHAAAVRELLPRLLQLKDSSTAEVPAAAERLSPEGVAGRGSVALQVVSFLLPAMLSWTSKHSDQHQQWVEFMLSPSSGCLDALAAYAVHATAAAGAPAPAAGSSSSNSSTGIDNDAGEAGGHLGSVCQVLFQLLSGRAVLLSARAQQHKQQQPAAAPCALPALQSAQAAALSAVLQGLSSWSVGQCQRRQQVQQQQQGSPQASVPQAIAAAEAVLVGLQAMGLQLSTLLPAAALTGQLLELVGPPAGGACAAAAKLLCWGCEIGWSLQLLAAYQQSSAAGGSCLAMPRVVLQQLLQVWEVAELDELWEACLLITAGLLTQLGPGSVLHHVLADAGGSGGWLSAAVQGVSVQGPKSDVVEAAAAVVDASTSLQLLLQAVSATM